MRKAGRKHFYAISQPEEYRGVYHDYWEPDVSAMARQHGAWHKRFEDRMSAQYFAAHGHEKGQDHKKGCCWVCYKEEEKEKENDVVEKETQCWQQTQRNEHRSSWLTATGELLERTSGTTIMLAGNASHPEEERRWLYAIHRPTKLQNVYSMLFNERPLLELGAIHEGFFNLEQAWYFMVHGHIRDSGPPLCVWCEEESQHDSAEELLKVQMERWIRIRKECTETFEFKKIDHSASLEPGEGFGQYNAVARGRTPGIYNDWDEAKKQVEGFSSNEYQKFRNRASAVRYLCSSGPPDDQIRLFRKTFTSQLNFTPNPKVEFKKEFKRLASSQQWTAIEARRARVDAIRDETIRHFLPDGVRISAEQDDDDGYMDLDDDQTLEIYLAMCRKAGKPTRDRPDQNISDRIDLCLITLKDKPYVNILDFVDMYRTGRPIRTFGDRNEFKRYNVVHKRVGHPSEWATQHHQHACAATVLHCTTRYCTVYHKIILFRLIAIFCILNFYFICAGVVTSLTISAAAPIYPHPLRRRLTVLTTTTRLFSN
jgi:hypothetical protein